MTLFDQANLAEIAHPDYPGERLIAFRNLLLATERARKRAGLLDATDALLAPVLAAVNQARLGGADAIGRRVGKIINKYQMAKHFHLTITDTTLTVTRNQTQIDAEAALTYTDEHPPPRTDPVAPTRRSPDANHKAARHHDEHVRPLHSRGESFRV